METHFKRYIIVYFKKIYVVIDFDTSVEHVTNFTG